MFAGKGVQTGTGNRWGDYTSMTLDPIDQCTFYYTNEYLKTNGAFNWSTRIATYRFSACVSAATSYGTVTGTITSSETGAPIPGVTVTLSNGYPGASKASRVGPPLPALCPARSPSGMTSASPISIPASRCRMPTCSSFTAPMGRAQATSSPIS